jgi:hypothetical protein
MLGIEQHVQPQIGRVIIVTVEVCVDGRFKLALIHIAELACYWFLRLGLHCRPFRRIMYNSGAS